MRAVKSALNSASTSSIFSTSTMASGYPLRVPGDMSMLCVSSFMAAPSSHASSCVRFGQRREIILLTWRVDTSRDFSAVKLVTSEVTQAAAEDTLCRSLSLKLKKIEDISS